MAGAIEASPEGPIDSRLAMLIRLIKGQRETDDPEAIMAAAAKAIGEHLRANRAGFIRLSGIDTLEIGPSWADGALEPLTGQWPLASLGTQFLAAMKAGRAVCASSIRLEPAVGLSKFGESGAIIIAPVLRGGAWQGALYVNSALPRHWTSGEIAFLCDVADIAWRASEQAQAITALRESERLFREIADVAPVLIWMSDATKACTWFNKPWLDFTGRPIEQQLGYGWAEGVHPDDFGRCVETYNGAFDRREPFRMDYRLKRHDGEWRTVNDIGVQRYSSDGTFLGYIGSCLDVTGEREAQQLLRESEARFRGIFEHAGTGIAIKDLEGRFQSCNPAYAAMLGYTMEELKETTCAQLMHADDGALNLVQQKRLAAGEISSYESLTRYLPKAGGILWAQRHISLLQDDSGHPSGIIVLVTDLTQHKRHEEQIKLLLREVNHRAKNILNVVQSIARQTSAATPDNFIERFSERLEALAANQDLLVRNAWRGVDLGELVCSQLAHYRDLIGSRIHLNGPQILISAATAQTIGMCVHELATNAAKYGALSNSDGCVEIHWSLDCQEAGKESFTMSWREIGGPPVAAPETSGFGSAIIGPLAEMSLSARTDLEFRPSGFSWRLACPAGEVLESNPSGSSSAAS
jgi:PAS domain S-box-containing protein